MKIEYVDLNDGDSKWLKSWKVINLLETIKEIGGTNLDNHPVIAEWNYQLRKRKGNDIGNLEWVGEDIETPIINEFLLSNGFEKGEKVSYWVCY